MEMDNLDSHSYGVLEHYADPATSTQCPLLSKTAFVQSFNRMESLGRLPHDTSTVINHV